MVYWVCQLQFVAICAITGIRIFIYVFTRRILQKMSMKMHPVHVELTVLPRPCVRLQECKNEIEYHFD